MWSNTNTRRIVKDNPQQHHTAAETIFATLCAMLLIFTLTACGGSASATPTASIVNLSAQVKPLATVYMSPTPNAQEQQATQLAIRPSATRQAIAPTPTATAYVGVFLGEADQSIESVLDAPLPPPTPTLPAELVTPSPAPCPFETDPVFGTNWRADVRVEQVLGCAVEAPVQFLGNVQIFERGVMYWRGDTNEIWALAQSPLGVGQYWYVPSAGQVDNVDIPAPEGLIVPVRGFGDVWRNVPGIRDALGFARTQEQPATLHTQRFSGGRLILDTTAGQVWALYNSGEVLGPY